MSSHLRRSVRAGSACSAWDRFENSQSRAHRRSRALMSYARDVEEPHSRSLHRHRVRPADVVPFLFISPPHRVHLGVLMR